jgi:DinB superfamily
MVTADAYRDNLFRRLGDREPLAVMSQTASLLADVVRTHPVSVLRARPFEGKWTPNEIIGHLVDGEWVYGYRLRLIVCEQNPPILGTQQDAWVVRQRHNDREPSELVAAFRTLRELNLAMWRGVAPVDFARTGQHNERGAESLAVMLRMAAGHDLSHLAQIRRYLEATGQNNQ